MPVLNWIGKDAVVRHDAEVPFRLLQDVPELACGDVNSGNLIVEGDNLLALKALLPHYGGQVKCIYIDPPYNTGNEGWVYNDNVNSPQMREWLGKVVGKEAEDLTRHDKWLCMMYPRLVLLKQFLREDGVLLISIDDNEIHHLRCIAREIPGLKFVGTIVWERKRKGSHLSRKLTKKTEYIAIFSLSSEEIELVGESVGEEEDFPLVKRTNTIKDLQIPCDKLGPTSLPDGTYAQGRYGRGGTTVELLTDTVVVDGRFSTDVALRGPFVWTQDNLDTELAAGGICFLRTKNMSLRALKGVANQGQKGLSSLLTKEIGTNEDASEELASIFGSEVNAVFQYSKPVGLIQTLIRAVTFNDKDAFVLDSFSGSGTTGHAVLKQNAEDGGHRRFILVEMDEDIARNVTAERMRRVAEGFANANGEAVPGLGGSFRYATLGKPLFNEHGHINVEVRFAELARFVWFMETGAPLASKRPASPLLGVHDGRAVYMLYNGILEDKSAGGGNVLTSPLLDELPPHDGPRVVYGTRCLINPERLRALRVVFKQLPYELKVAR